MAWFPCRTAVPRVTKTGVASSTATNWRQEQIRVDQNLSDKTQIFVRWTQDAWNTIAVPALWTSSNSDTIKTPFLGPGKSGVVHFTHTFKPNLMNEFVVGYSVDHISLYNQAGSSSPAHSIDKPSDWTVQNLFSANASNPLLPSISVNGFTADAGNHPWFNSNPIVDFKDNVAWMTGNHAVKFSMSSRTTTRTSSSAPIPRASSTSATGVRFHRATAWPICTWAASLHTLKAPSI